MKTVSIGFQREDGDFQVLATLNNKDELMSEAMFNELVGTVASSMCRELVCEIQIMEREDAPDYVELGDAA